MYLIGIPVSTGMNLHPIYLGEGSRTAMTLDPDISIAMNDIVVWNNDTCIWSQIEKYAADS